MTDEIQNIHYCENFPADSLKKIINAYWVFEYSSNAEGVYPLTVLPDGCPSLILFSSQKGNYKNVNIFGPRITQFDIDIYPGTIVVGVRFFPSMISNIFNIDSANLRDKNIPLKTLNKNHKLCTLAEIIHPRFNSFEKLDKTFLEIVKYKNQSIENDVIYAVHRIIDLNGNLKVTDIASRCDVSVRNLQRKFRKHVGLTLKEFARIRRVRSALIELILQNSKLQDTVFRSGYFDQAHFNKDLLMISGLNPTELKKLYSQITHGKVF